MGQDFPHSFWEIYPFIKPNISFLTTQHTSFWFDSFGLNFQTSPLDLNQNYMGGNFSHHSPDFSQCPEGLCLEHQDRKLGGGSQVLN